MADAQQPTPAIDTSFAHAITPTIALASQAACVLAVYFGASHSLKRWTAASSLQAPPLVERPVTEEQPKKGWARIFNKQFGAAIGGMAIFISMQVFVLVIMPKIKSRPVINTIWLTFMAICMSCTFEGLIRVCLPSQDSLSIIQNVKAKKPTYMLKNETKRHKAWAAAPIAMAFVAIMSTYLGTQIAIPLTAFAWTMTCIAYFTPTKIIAKHLIVLLNGYLMAVVVLAFVIGGVASLFDSKSDDKANKPKDNDEITLPSIWVFQIMLTFVLAIPATAPGQILAMAYRFDHSKTSSVTNLAAGPGEAVVVPTSMPSSPKPTFYAGLFALAVSLLGVKVLDITMLGLPNGLESVYLFVTVPVVTFAIFGSAWSRGQLREFWNYTETWVPNAEGTSAVKSDVEAVPAAEADNEKDGLLQTKA